ncbi:Succinate dehydrogenase flavoprotein subunit [Rubellimicrobium mesophilum DSM 19309]|uniref:Succinate dehydrogenase flavoprotein subunit n=1 Tax=Rubellimicrobium mesophilum DSM 19309 TaxID=442562 RepID=A0A017HPW5_9RHOB|nr:Succinate dehydrogenase flavoprotein subunit [Rubellimicrobium mesophilum DSM 19309]
MAGAISGGGAVNSSWAIASGWWAGQGALAYACRRGAPRRFRHHVAPMGGVGLRPSDSFALDPREVKAAVRAEVAPLDRNFFREGGQLAESLSRLDGLWSRAIQHLGGEGADRLRPREAASGLAAARWLLTGALARTESRGMHRRLDHPATDEGPVLRYALRGVHRIEVEPQGAEAALEEAAS